LVSRSGVEAEGVEMSVAQPAYLIPRFVRTYTTSSMHKAKRRLQPPFVVIAAALTKTVFRHCQRDFRFTLAEWIL
jgi:hypothetical protein